MIKAILLDFNGVLIDDEPIQMRAYQEILEKEGITLTEADYYSCLGMDDASFVAAAYDRAGKAPAPNKILEVTQAKTEKWRESIAGRIPLFDGVENFVRKMANDFTLGIVSMASREEIEHVLETSGMADKFSVIVCAGEARKPKPDPECYRIGFRKIDSARTSGGHLPMTHGECLVIEDSPAGVIAARSADLPTLGVTNTVGAEELRAAGANQIAADLNDWMPHSVRRVFV
ncbi:MAG: HAD family phosphatase [Pyrinomonadaceae bacterium]